MWRAPRPNRARVVERLDGRQHPVEVEQRLAHPHEHDVRQPLAVRRQPAGRVADLVDDLGGREVAREPELARRAERAADRAAGLARDAQRVPLAAGATRRVMHQDRFDERAVVELVERLLGQAAVGRGEARCRRRCRSGRPRPARSAARRGVARSTRGRSCRRRSRTRRRPAAPDTAGWPCSATQASSSGGVTPERPGRSSSVTGSMLAQPAHAAGRTALPMMPGRPRTQASQDIGFPPAGWTDPPGRPPSAVDSAIARRTCPEVRRRVRPDAGRVDHEPTDDGLEERPGPRLIGPDLPLELRGGAPGIEPAVLAAERSGQRDAVGRLGVPPRARLAATARGHPSRTTAARSRSSRLQRWRRLGAVEGDRPLRHDRPGVEPVVHPDERDASLAVAGKDRGRDRGRPAMSRQQRRVEVQRPARRDRGAPTARSARSRRGRPARGRRARIAWIDAASAGAPGSGPRRSRGCGRHRRSASWSGASRDRPVGPAR